MMHHSWWDSSGRVISLSQRPLPDNTHNRHTFMPLVGFKPTISAGERPLACWDLGFESHRGHGYLSVVSVVCCQMGFNSGFKGLNWGTVCEVREVRHTQRHGGKEGKAEEISIWITFCFVVISCDIVLLLPVLFAFGQVWYRYNHCFHFVFHSLCICCTGVTVSCGSTGETSLHHTFYKTSLYKCEVCIFRWHLRREELQYM